MPEQQKGFTEDDGWVLVEHVVKGNEPGITDWLNTHARSRGGLHQVLETLPRWVSSLGQIRRPLDADEIAMIHFGDGASDASRDAARAIAAAYNDDWDALTGICLAVIESPMPHIEEVLQHELSVLHTVLTSLRAPTKPEEADR